MKKVIFLYQFIISVLVYLWYPEYYTQSYVTLCAVLYVAFFIFFLYFQKKSNYFDFDTLFIITLFFATQYYGVFLHGEDILSRYFVFSFPYNNDFIPQASALSLLGLSSYILGSGMINKKNHLSKLNNNALIKKQNPYFILAFITFLLYITLGGYAKIVALYNGDNPDTTVGLAEYAYLFTPAFLFTGIIIELYKSYHTGKLRLKKINVFIVAFILFMLIATTSRTVPMQIILLFVGLGSLLFYRINLWKFIALLAIGSLSLFSLVLVREGVNGRDFYFSDIFMDIFSLNRVSFIAIEYVKDNGLTYGESMLGMLLAPFPFLSNILINVFGFNTNEISSSYLYTFYTLSKTENFGLGTNVIADIYFSFGSIGVVIFMVSLGAFIRKIHLYVKHNIYYMTAYGIMMSYAVFLVRSEYFFPLKYLLWSLLFVFLFNKITLHYEKNSTHNTQYK